MRGQTGHQDRRASGRDLSWSRNFRDGDDVRRLVYAEPGGRFVTRSASVQVFSEGENRTRLVWINDFLPNYFAALIRGNMDKAVVVMKPTLEASAGH